MAPERYTQDRTRRRARVLARCVVACCALTLYCNTAAADDNCYSSATCLCSHEQPRALLDATVVDDSVLKVRVDAVTRRVPKEAGDLDVGDTIRADQWVPWKRQPAPVGTRMLVSYYIDQQWGVTVGAADVLDPSGKVRCGAFDDLLLPQAETRLAMLKPFTACKADLNALGLEEFSCGGDGIGCTVTGGGGGGEGDHALWGAVGLALLALLVRRLRAAP